MTNNKEIVKQNVLKVLEQHPCLNAKEIAFFVKQIFGGDLMSPQTVSGLLRPLVSAGKVCKDSTSGKTVYWICDSGKRIEVRR